MIHDLPDSGYSQHAFTKVLDQKTLDECARSLGRPLWAHEVRILDEILEAQMRVNLKLIKRGQADRTHSVDEIVHVFTQRVQSAEARQMTDRIIKQYGI